MENSSNNIKIKLSPYFLIIYLIIILGMIFIRSDLYRDLVVIPATSCTIGYFFGIMHAIINFRNEKR